MFYGIFAMVGAMAEGQRATIGSMARGAWRERRPLLAPAALGNPARAITMGKRSRPPRAWHDKEKTMARNYCPIVGTLAYILSPDRKQVLLVHRNARPEDVQLGKYNGLGGHLERDEDVLTCIVREIREEAGITCTKTTLRGTINWTGFGKNGEDWLGFIFLVEEFEGTPFQKNEEGTLSWVEIDKMHELPMWEGDRHFLPLVFDGDPRPFHGFMPYDNDKPLSWSYVR